MISPLVDQQKNNIQLGSMADDLLGVSGPLDRALEALLSASFLVSKKALKSYIMYRIPLGFNKLSKRWTERVKWEKKSVSVCVQQINSLVCIQCGLNLIDIRYLKNKDKCCNVHSQHITVTQTPDW